jgi:hypothetical protein
MSENEMEAYVRKVQAETRRYIQGLLDENQKLRVATATLQSDKARLDQQVFTMREELEHHRHQELKLERELADIAAENRHYSEEFVVVEQQNSSLANLYVAMSRIHSTLDRDEVLATVIDIVEFLVGCEQIALFTRDGELLRLAASKGIDAARWASVPLGEGAIGRTAVTGEAWLTSPDAPGPDELTACIPLRLNGGTSGVLALFRLLPQKGGKLASIDHELFDLLGTQAANSLYCATLAGAASREATGV